MRSRCINEVIVATTVDISDDPIERIALSRGVKCIRGSEKDVLGRYCSALNYTNADVLVRITGDCPLIDPSVVDSVIDLFVEGEFDYCSNCLPPTFPDGYDVEVFHVRYSYKLVKFVLMNTIESMLLPGCN